jgi:hypothetical protein
MTDINVKIDSECVLILAQTTAREIKSGEFEKTLKDAFAKESQENGSLS